MNWVRSASSVRLVAGNLVESEVYFEHARTLEAMRTHQEEV